MRCPFCGAEDTRVVDSRLIGEGEQVRRRRECQACNERFTTFEIVDLTLPRVVKSDGNRESFEEAKLRRGFLRALEKRPVGTEDVEAALERIRHKLITLGEREIDAKTLGEWVMLELRRMDEVAYVRFASVYRSFQDVNAFRELIERLEQETRLGSGELQLKLIADEEQKRNKKP